MYNLYIANTDIPPTGFHSTIPFHIPSYFIHFDFRYACLYYNIHSHSIHGQTNSLTPNSVCCGTPPQTSLIVARRSPRRCSRKKGNRSTKFDFYYRVGSKSAYQRFLSVCRSVTVCTPPYKAIRRVVSSHTMCSDILSLHLALLN